jgi:hypothetical protein
MAQFVGAALLTVILMIIAHGKGWTCFCLFRSAAFISGKCCARSALWA